MYQFLANIVLAAHLAFIVFVLCGGLLALRWPRLAWLHLPAAVWGVLIEFMGWTCPLTPLENFFLELAGGTSYQGDFITRYLWPVLYPAGLTPMIQYILGALVIVVNGIIYAVVIRRSQTAGEK